MSILDVTDPRNPVLLRHVPPTGDEASGTQHVQVCDGSMLPNGDPDRVYLVRTNGLLGYEMLDVTDPAEPHVMLTIARTGIYATSDSLAGSRMPRDPIQRTPYQASISRSSWATGCTSATEAAMTVRYRSWIGTSS